MRTCKDCQCENEDFRGYCQQCGESLELPEYQQIMDRLEGRILCYKNTASRCKGGRKQYTAAQMQTAKAQAMQEARIIVWTHHEGKPDNQNDTPSPT